MDNALAINFAKMKWKAIVILLIILVSLLPAYFINKYLLKVLRPRQSLGKLLVYLLSSLLLVFIYTFLIVFIIKWIFPNA
jgi:hypothetical protein